MCVELFAKTFIFEIVSGSNVFCSEGMFICTMYHLSCTISMINSCGAESTTNDRDHRSLAISDHD